MLKSILEGYPKTDISVHVVWVPMLGGDSEDAARKISGMFDDPRVQQYWDPQRLSGTAYARDVFPTMFRDMAASLPDDHAMAAMLKPILNKRAGAAPEQAPLWDTAFFYDKNAVWEKRAPTPSEWIKQIAFMGGRSDGVTGVFWLGDFAKPPVDSDWHVELSKAMKELIGSSGSQTGDGPTSLGTSLDPLKEHFNSKNGQRRFVALLSPT